MKPPALPPVPAPQPWACLGCRWGFRIVNYGKPEPEDDEDEEKWKEREPRILEGYLCTHPVMVDAGDRSVAVVGRLYCELRESKGAGDGRSPAA